MTPFWTTTIYYVLLLVTFSSIYTIVHEEAHKAINTQYRIDSEIVYNPLYLGGYTKATNLTSWKQYEQTIPYHLQNEIVGYNVFTVVLAVLSGVYLIIVYMELRRIADAAGIS